MSGYQLQFIIIYHIEKYEINFNEIETNSCMCLTAGISTQAWIPILAWLCTVGTGFSEPVLAFKGLIHNCLIVQFYNVTTFNDTDPL